MEQHYYFHPALQFMSFQCQGFCDVNARDNNGKTAKDLAASKPSPLVLQLLKEDVDTSPGTTALQRSTQMSHNASLQTKKVTVSVFVLLFFIMLCCAVPCYDEHTVLCMCQCLCIAQIWANTSNYVFTVTKITFCIYVYIILTKRGLRFILETVFA